MTVDDEDLRAEAQFKSDVSESAKAGTRSNMLASVNAADYPYASAHMDAIVAEGQLGSTEILVDVLISLHGTSKVITVPLTVSMDSTIGVVEGKFTLRQTDFGIKPYSVLGGALAVRDELDLTIEIYALRLDTI